ncbi:MAG: hypothetical protein O3C57_07935, partial [Verrucomicrobia bacterium]|nr:hypothetical protein [Verrucomicrobiota bacterium]
TLADDLTENPGHDARRITVKDAARNRITATLLFTSLGIPMIAEGQDYLRSKRGIRNSFDKGDVINALDWSERDQPLARQAMRYYADLSALRASDAGRTFRWRDAVPEDYIEWVEPPGQRQVLGYGINLQGAYPGAGFMVILNTSDTDARLSVPFTQGEWKLIGDGVRVSPRGIREVPGVSDAARELKIKAPAFTALIFMRASEVPAPR